MTRRRSKEAILSAEFGGGKFHGARIGGPDDGGYSEQHWPDSRCRTPRLVNASNPDEEWFPLSVPKVSAGKEPGGGSSCASMSLSQQQGLSTERE